MKVAIVQICSELSPEKNLEKIEGLLATAHSQGAKAAFLPECFYSMSDGLTSTPYVVDANNPDCEHLKNIQNLAKNADMALIGGSAATTYKGNIVNRVYNVSASGELWPSYDKRYLFSCALKDKSIDEADIYTPGNRSEMLTFEDLKIGLGVCFDIRYPELALEYRLKAANVLTYSSAFTVPTGKAHWHLLNRARAVENQLYVISSAQWGEHNERIKTFGHSLVIDPWGDVLLDLKEGESVGVVEIDLEKVKNVRKMVDMKREN